MGDSVLGARGNWQERSSDSYFQKLILGTQSFHLLISRKGFFPGGSVAKNSSAMQVTQETQV